MYGGFFGNESTIAARHGSATILSGDIGTVGDNTDNAYHVVLSISDAATTILDGFTVSGGNANSNNPNDIIVEGNGVNRHFGGGAYCLLSPISINNMIFSNNSASRAGGGLVNISSSPTITNSTFSNNSTTYGGGLANDTSSPTITNTTFSGNTASINGGGMYNITSSSPTITNTTFSGNTASDSGGGMYNITSSSPTITNTTFSGNTASINGGGMCNITSSSPTITNTTFSGNTASINGGGIFNNNVSFPSLKNTILWGNTAPNEPSIYNYNNSTPTVTYSIVEGGYPGTGNSSNNPLFANAALPAGADGIWRTADDGLRPTACSPAINAGNNTGMTATTDITGATRIVETTVDMGAYEYQGIKILNDFTVATTTVCPGATGIAYTITGTAGTYTWAYSGTGATINNNGTNSITVDFAANATSGDLTVSHSLGCSRSLAITVNTPPTLALTPATATNCTGAPILLTATTTSISNTHAFTFDGTKRIDLANPNDFAVGTAPFTIEAWVRPAAQATATRRNIAAFGTGADGIMLFIGADNKLHTDKTGIAGPVSDANTWYHTALTLNAGIATIYLDGVNVGSAGLTPYIDLGGIAEIGNSTAMIDAPFVGDIDEVRVWSIARTATELFNNKDYPIATQTGLIGLYNMNNNLSDAATASNNEGTVNPAGAAVYTTTNLLAQFNYAWSSGATTPTYSATTSGIYTVTLTNTLTSCAATRSIIVTINTGTPRVYVNAAALVSGNGSTWATAFKTIEEGLTACNVEEIWVQNGTYYPTAYPQGCTDCTTPRDYTFHLRNGVKLYGGFFGNETTLAQRPPSSINSTILSGDIGTVNDATTTIIDGFTVTSGNANNAVMHTIETQAIDADYGGGMENEHSSPTITNMIFSNNSATFGGGLANYTSSPSISNTVFSNNTATNEGGGLANNATSAPILTNIIFDGNTAQSNGGGMASNSSAPIVTNATFTNNTADFDGGGLYLFFSDGACNNCILFNNTVNGLANNILKDNSTTTITYSIIEGATVYTGTGNSNANPMFVAPLTPKGADNTWRTADDGLRLQCNSTAINTGDPSITTGNDIITVPTFDARRDIGAYEGLCQIYTNTAGCNSIVRTNINGNGWFDFYNQNGIVASINPNGMNMGTVTAEVSDAANAIVFNNNKFLGRSVNFSSSNYPSGTSMPTNYSLRVYYYDTELVEYNTATSGTYTLADINMAWAAGGTGCALATYGGGTNGLIDKANISESDYGMAGAGFYLQFALNHFTIFAATTGAGAPLPVKLLSFTGYNKNNTNLLHWTTASELNNLGFNVQRSTNGIDFKNIGFVQGNGTTNTLSRYNFIDTKPNNAINYYRLEQMDIDRNYEYSNIITIKNNIDIQTIVYPNPTTDILNISTDDYTKPITITDVIGHVIYSNNNTPLTIDISDFIAGTYFVKIDYIIVKIIKN
jgi:parallel beta-helix repeat protein